MKKNNLLVYILIFLLIGTNAYWLIDKYRTNNRENNNATKMCEQNELIYCLRKFKTGTQYYDFKLQLKTENLTISKEWNNGQNKFIEIEDILRKCPRSGRHYCGIFFIFKNDILTDIERGDPCH